MAGELFEKIKDSPPMRIGGNEARSNIQILFNQSEKDRFQQTLQMIFPADSQVGPRCVAAIHNMNSSNGTTRLDHILEAENISGMFASGNREAGDSWIGFLADPENDNIHEGQKLTPRFV